MPAAPIAVVIPCFNHADVLRRTIERLSCQTVQPAEVVVVDDGSTDHPEQAIPSYVRLIRLDQNHGAPYARNLGAKETTAPFLLFLDADAQLVPDALETLWKTLEAHPEADFAYSNFTWGVKQFRGREFSEDVLKKGNYIHTSSLIRRSAFPGFDESLKKFQDWDLWLTMGEHGSRGVWIDRDLYTIEPRCTGQGMSDWLPSFAYRLPWPLFGWTPRTILKYQEAERIIRTKHGL